VREQLGHAERVFVLKCSETSSLWAIMFFSVLFVGISVGAVGIGRRFAGDFCISRSSHSFSHVFK